MSELEKILEEIDLEKKRISLSRDCSNEYAVTEISSLEKIEKIIRKHMNNDIEIIEPCPHCANEVVLHWDVEKDGYEVYCPYCGFPMMLCSMCDARDGSVCDWEEIKGCKHSGERYRDYFRKHMNDRWISVEECLPEDDVDVLITYADIDDENYTDICITTYGYAYLGGHKLDFKEWKSPFEYFKTNYKVIAWRPLPEPYRPERSEGE